MAEAEWNVVNEAPEKSETAPQDGWNVASETQAPPKDTPRWDLFGDIGRAFRGSVTGLTHDVGEAFPSLKSVRKEQDKDIEDYGQVGGRLMAPVRSVQRMGNAARIPLDALGVVASPLTGALHSTLGSMLSYLPPGPTPKKDADEAVDTAMLGLRPTTVARPHVAAPGEALQRRAAETVERRFRQDEQGGGPSAAEAAKRLEDARQRGTPLALVDVGGENTRGLAGNVARQPGPARNQITTRFQEAGEGAGARLDAEVRRSLGSDSMFQTTQRLLDVREKSAAPLYSEAESLEVVWSERLQQFLDEPRVKSGLARGYELERLAALREGRPFDPTQMGVTLDAEGNIQLLRTPNVRVLDMGKRGLDAMIAEERNDLTNKLSSLGRELDGVRRAYVKEIDGLDKSGVYARAREAWAGPSASLDALRQGRGHFRQSPEEGAHVFNRLSPNDQEFYRLGVADAMREEMGKKGITAPQVRDLARGSRNNFIKEQIRPLFKTEAEYNRFIDLVTDERAIFNAERDVLRGSQTAGRMAEDAGGSPGLDLATNATRSAVDLFRGHPLQSMRHALQARRDLGVLRQSPELNQEIARLLTDHNLQMSPTGRLLPNSPGPLPPSQLQRILRGQGQPIAEAVNPPMAPP